MEQTLITVKPVFVYILYPTSVILIGIILVVVGMGMIPQTSTADNMGSTFFGLTCCCPGVLIIPYGLYMFVMVLIGMRVWHLTVTTHRVIVCSGVVRRTEKEMLLHQIESISIKKGLVGMIFNMGRIVVGGTGGTRLTSVLIANPGVIRDQINAAINARL